MTDRQKALLAYLATIRPQLDGAHSPEEMVLRVAKCAAEDMSFVGEGFANAFISMGRAALEQHVGYAVGELSQKMQSFVVGLFHPRPRKPSP